MTLNKETIIPALEKAVRYTFENTLFIDFDDAREIATPEFKMYDQLTFIKINSPFGGELYLAIGYDLAFKLLESIYNEKDDNVLMMMVDEIMAEICNTVTGCFMAEVVPADIEFNFGLPTCTKISREKSIHNMNENIVAMQFVHQDKPVYCMFKN
jgi:CheY-specific phosphatase CheX